jgi:hypothetical protein
MAGAFSAGLPSPLLPWQLTQGANSRGPSPENTGTLLTSNTAMAIDREWLNDMEGGRYGMGGAGQRNNPS